MAQQDDKTRQVLHVQNEHTAKYPKIQGLKRQKH